MKASKAAHLPTTTAVLNCTVGPNEATRTEFERAFFLSTLTLGAVGNSGGNLDRRD